MTPFKSIWGLLFRLFPCPTPVGLRRVGEPDRNSPVLVTCNFHTTVERLTRVLRKADVNAWLLVADSKGVNVWCAAGGDEFTTHSVVSAVKTSAIADRVDHRHLILPPLGAPAIRIDEVREQTGFSPRWGPVRAADIPAYLANDMCRSEAMKRVTYDWKERLDTALGSLFPFYLLGVLGFMIFGRGLLLDYVVVAALSFVVFMLACPWLPGSRGITKVLVLEMVLGAALVASELFFERGSLQRSQLLIAMAMLLVYGSELGGLSPTAASDLDPFLARMGIGALGNVALAGTVRTELLNGVRKLGCDRELCNGCRLCFEVCPQGVWDMDDAKRAVLAHPAACTACRACLVQCPTGAVSAPLVTGQEQAEEITATQQRGVEQTTSPRTLP